MTIPLDLRFTDEYGHAVQLADYFKDRPVILVLVYYQCPMLCTMVLNDLLRTMRSMPETAGRDFDVLTVSFDPRDTPELALRKQETYLAQYDRPVISRIWSLDYPEEIRPGMVFALETQHGKVHEFGVRLEEMLLVTDDGHELLSTYASDRIIEVG